MLFIELPELLTTLFITTD